MFAEIAGMVEPVRLQVGAGDRNFGNGGFGQNPALLATAFGLVAAIPAVIISMTINHLSAVWRPQNSES